MVFKAVTGANQRAQNAYKSGDTYAESEMDALDVTKKYPNDYKNRIVLRWGEFKPSEVSMNIPFTCLKYCRKHIGA